MHLLRAYAHTLGMYVQAARRRQFVFIAVLAQIVRTPHLVTPLTVQNRCTWAWVRRLRYILALFEGFYEYFSFFVYLRRTASGCAKKTFQTVLIHEYKHLRSLFI